MYFKMYFPGVRSPMMVRVTHLRLGERAKCIQKIVTFLFSSWLYLAFPFLSGIAVHMEVRE